MNSKSTAKALAALGHEARLDVYKLLVRAGQDGLIIGDIATHMSLPLSTLAYHLNTLVKAGLVIQDQDGREVINRVDYSVMDQTLAYLTSECCDGVSIVRNDIS